MFAILSRDNGLGERNLNKQNLPELPQLTQTWPISLQLSLVIVLFLVQVPYLNYFQQLRGRLKLFLSLLGVDYVLLKTICMPKWHILRHVLNIFSIRIFLLQLRNYKYITILQCVYYITICGSLAFVHNYTLLCLPFF